MSTENSSHIARSPKAKELYDLIGEWEDILLPEELLEVLIKASASLAFNMGATPASSKKLISLFARECKNICDLIWEHANKPSEENE